MSSNLTPNRARSDRLPVDESSLEFSQPREKVGKEICDQAASTGAYQKRPRLEEFRANNYINNSVKYQASLMLPISHVTHVLCCPKCAFMSLQEETLALHAQTQHAISAVTVYRCSLCQAASTQAEIMEEHALIYHGLQGQTEILHHLLPCSAAQACQIPQQGEGSQSSPTSSGSRPPVGSKKRKSNVPERIKLPQLHLTPDTSAKRSKPSASCAELSELQNQPVFIIPHAQIPNLMAITACPPASDPLATPAPLDLSLKRQHQQHQQQLQQQQQQPQGLQAAAESPSPAKQLPAEAAGLAQQQTPPQSCRPQRQNFTEQQNSLLQSWFSQHKDKPYPSTADTRLLAGISGLSYSQVKKWFANRRMRTKTSQALGLNQTTEGENASSAGLASPCSPWSQ